MFTINALLSSCSVLRSVADPGEGPGMGPPYFYTKLRPEGSKKILGGPGSPRYAPLLSKGLCDWPPPPPLSQVLDPALKMDFCFGSYILK